jgi:CRP-like cAMP-binding protein
MIESGHEFVAPPLRQEAAMLLLQPSRQHQGVPFAAREGWRGVLTPSDPRRNHLLAALPPETYARLRPDLKPVALPKGSVIHGAGHLERYLYFVTEGIVSRVYTTSNGESVESAVTGREGVIGIASVLGGLNMPGWALALSDGFSFRLGVELLGREMQHDGPLSRVLLRYIDSLMGQTGRIAACNRHHSLEQRLSRWILSCLDRMATAEMAMTHELIAEMLGVRREGVTQAAGILQDAGMVHCGRGRLAVLDRQGLEARACECYAVLKREHERLIRPGSRMGDAGEKVACGHSPRDLACAVSA